MNGNPFPVRACASVSTAEKQHIPVVARDLEPSSSQEWADTLLSDVPLYLILGHLTRVHGFRWEGNGVLRKEGDA